MSRTIESSAEAAKNAFVKAIEADDDFALANISENGGIVEVRIPGWIGRGDWYTAEFEPAGKSTAVTVKAFTDGPMAGAVAQYTTERLNTVLATVAKAVGGLGLE